MEIEEYAKVLGADVFGIADLEILKDYPTYPPKLLNKYTRGVSIGVKISDDVFDGLPETRPIYARQYQVVNDLLDKIAVKLSRYIEKKGYKALPIPASKIIKGLNWRSFISHKAIARALE